MTCVLAALGRRRAVPAKPKLTTEQRLNKLEKDTHTSLQALHFVVEELLPRFEAALERLTRAEERLDHIADNTVMNDLPPGVGRDK